MHYQLHRDTSTVAQHRRSNVTSCAGQNTKLVLHVRPTQNHLHKGTAGLTSTGQVQHKSGAVHGAEVMCEVAPDWNMQHEQQSPSQSRLQWLVSTRHEQPPYLLRFLLSPCHLSYAFLVYPFLSYPRPAWLLSCCVPGRRTARSQSSTTSSTLLLLPLVAFAAATGPRSFMSS